MKDEITEYNAEEIDILPRTKKAKYKALYFMKI